MGQLKMRVRILNAREVAMARLGHLPEERIHSYEAQALVDTGATRCILPPFMAEQLALILLVSFAEVVFNGSLVFPPS